VSSTPLACSVRGCGLPLARDTRAWACPRGHAFDVARSGYVNLLQPQDRRSPGAGDAKAAVETRMRLFAAGVGGTLVAEVVRQCGTLGIDTGAAVVDIGCGAGDLLAALISTRLIQGIGIDLSAAAAELAARRFPDLTWVVANADRRLPLVDASVALVTSLHARRNPAECARVLGEGGTLLVAVPAADDLIELRESVLGDGVERDRGAALLAEHEPLFTLLSHCQVRERHALERATLLDLLRTTYRGARTSAAERVGTLDRLDVTLASDVFLFRRRATASGRSSSHRP
jgi:23S rRNA (guanine745-N1)-methyltransferase